LKIKARFTRNENQFKQKDTAGVRFITSKQQTSKERHMCIINSTTTLASDPTSVYRISKIYRFVEELVVEADPEHQGEEAKS